MIILLFEYMYRDADNFKAVGAVTLRGNLSEGEISGLKTVLAPDDLFIAEQIGIPPLYQGLYQWNGGPTGADHCWHTFLRIRPIEEADAPDYAADWGAASDFRAALASVTQWREELSPHFTIGKEWMTPMRRLRRLAHSRGA